MNTTTTSKTRPCPNCFFPMRVRFSLDDKSGKWIVGAYYDPTKPERPELDCCPVCGFELKDIDEKREPTRTWPLITPAPLKRASNG
jgi:hypothetical protein